MAQRDHGFVMVVETSRGTRTDTLLNPQLPDGKSLKRKENRTDVWMFRMELNGYTVIDVIWLNRIY